MGARAEAGAKAPEAVVCFITGDLLKDANIFLLGWVRFDNRNRWDFVRGL